MAVIYQNQGNLNKAEKLHLYSLKIKIEKFGLNHIYLAETYNNLATIY